MQRGKGRPWEGGGVKAEGERARAGSWPHELVPIDHVSSLLQFLPQLPLPVGIIERNVNDPVEVGGLLDITFHQSRDALRLQFSDKKSKLEDHVLPSARIEIGRRSGLAEVVGCQARPQIPRRRLLRGIS